MVDWEAFYAEFRRPDFVPGYVIEGRLGSGAFGEVFRARKTSIDKLYAIKFLRVDEEAAEEAVGRELEAVRHFAAIDHPNLVTIEDVGSVQGIPYLVMGYAGDETLARLLARGPLDRERALEIFVQVCRGVLALHDRSLAHFDLKPGNVFLRGNLARVGDYGLAKLLVDGRQTLSVGRGTPHYMAPEMLRGRADRRADLYSLGVMLYECLTGTRPYCDGRNEGLLLRESDEPPSFPPDFPHDLVGVVTRLLRLDPADRYPGIPELLADLGESTGSRVAHTEGNEAETLAAEPTSEPPTPTRISDIVSVATLEDADDSSPAASSSPAPWRRELERSREARQAERGSGLLAAGALAAHPVDESRSGTVPVPPAAAGGAVGNVMQSFVVGVEILGTLLSAPFVLFGRNSFHLVEAVQSGVPGIFGRALRFLLPIFVLAILGGLSAFVLLVVISRAP